MSRFCPKCHWPVEIDPRDPGALCSNPDCNWFCDASETIPLPKPGGNDSNLTLLVRQALELFRDTCHKEVVIESAYLQGRVSHNDRQRVKYAVADSINQLILLFQNVHGLGNT